MINLNVRLPPLNALRVFQTVARHRSFLSAAEELSVTPQAVSQQIKLLEDAIGADLFKRWGRAIKLNEEAILPAHYAQAAFAALEEGVRPVAKADTCNRIKVNASLHGATRYLPDRITRLRGIAPEADLRLKMVVDLPDFVADDVDVAVQWGFSGRKWHKGSLLLRDYKVICCTPEMARQLTGTQDLQGVALLHLVVSADLWPNILRFLRVAERSGQNDIPLVDAATMRRATGAGLGIGLLSTIDAAEDVKLGKQVAPFGKDAMHRIPEAQIPGFYLVLPKAHRRVNTIDTFCRWIAAEDWLSTDPAVPDGLGVPARRTGCG